MRRYFMLISEAVELVTHAATLAEPGTVYVLEMGDPISIVDMARQIVRLAGYRPGADIPIRFTGLRPGERLNESLVDETEQTAPCATRGLFRVVPEVLPAEHELAAHLAKLQQQLRAPGATITLDTLLEPVPRLEPAAVRQAVG
jgi:FlaA1/EpsC-like NDP-sugar epimerase